MNRAIDHKLARGSLAVELFSSRTGEEPPLGYPRARTFTAEHGRRNLILLRSTLD